MLVMLYECVIMQNKQRSTLICIVRSSLYDMKAGQQEVIVPPQVDYNLGNLWFLCSLFSKNYCLRHSPGINRQ